MKRVTTFVLAWLVLGLVCAPAQLFDNLQALGGHRYPVGDPEITLTNDQGAVIEGPKDIAVADLDGDGFKDFAVANEDWSLSLYFGLGNGEFGGATLLRTWIGTPPGLVEYRFTNYVTNIVCDFQPVTPVVRCYTIPPPPPLPGMPPGETNSICFTNYEYECVGWITNVLENVWSIDDPVGLRGLAVADWTGDGLPDLAVASPQQSAIFFFANLGGRQFSPPAALPGWFGVRDLAAGDFDGDGWMDLAAAGATNGVAQFRGLGGGAFGLVGNLTALASKLEAQEGDEESSFEEDYDFPQPAYYLKAIRHPGDTRDELIASFAKRRVLWVLRAGADGRLAISGSLSNVNLTAMDAGPLLGPAVAGAPPDLLTAYSRGGCVDIYAATNTPTRFHDVPVQRLYVPGAPRNVRIADLDQDGWNDIVVVAQTAGRALVYKNVAGQFLLASEALTGQFPREMDLGDFNGDARPDLAVLNRQSHDVSILITAEVLEPGAPVGFLALDNMYPVDGGVSGLELRDFNGDGRPDVMQLHRDTSEFSVRITDANGALGPPAFYVITNAFKPAAQIAVDVNGDGFPDMVSANLSGSVTVSLGQPDGSFGEGRTFSLPPGAGGSLFALVPADFDGDGRVDLAAGYLDCRVSFFRGDGMGGFTFAGTHMFIYEPRSMAAADLDQDGDMDLVGGSWMTKFVVVENEGTLLDVPELRRTEYGNAKKSGATLTLVDQNQDGDPDVLLGSPGVGFDLWLGGPGVTFTDTPVDNGDNDPGIVGSTFVVADLDGQGANDLAIICSSNVCLTIQVFTNGQFVSVLTVPIPFTRFLAAGDLDGDGLTDLVGSGQVLWVALSSRPATMAPPAEPLAARRNGGVVINEVLAKNEGLPLSQDADRESDWIEIFNGAPEAVPLANWRLELVRTNLVERFLTNTIGPITLVTTTNVPVAVTNTFTFPTDVPLPSASHRLVICTSRVRSPYHTGFALPAEGGTLRLLNAEGSETDRVAYPPAEDDVSHARYTDGAQAFVANLFPSPGAPNVDNGPVEPVVNFDGVDLAALRTPGQPLRFRARARDDIGIVNLSVMWRRLDILDNETKRVILFDDGMNEDGDLNDGVFVGVMDAPLPAGAEIQFYLECTDLSDLVVTRPGNPRFGSPGRAPSMHALAVGVPPPPLEISEILASNATGLRDESGGTADWIEIRNISDQTVSLAGVVLSEKLFGNNDRMVFDRTPSLQPGEHLLVFADGNPDQGLLHAPFRLDASGDEVWLAGTTANGARYLIDTLAYGPQVPDVALSRLGAGGPWAAGPPTPRAGNVEWFWRGVARDGVVTFAFPTRAGHFYRTEYRDNIATGEWIALPAVQSVGIEHSVSEPMGSQRFFRVVEE